MAIAVAAMECSAWSFEYAAAQKAIDQGDLGSTAYTCRQRSWWYWARPALLLVPIVVFAFRKYRRSWWVAWALAFVLCDPFRLFERFVIVITSLHRDYLPASWTMYHVDPILPAALVLSAPVMWWAQRRTLQAKTNSTT